MMYKKLIIYGGEDFDDFPEWWWNFIKSIESEFNAANLDKVTDGSDEDFLRKKLKEYNATIWPRSANPDKDPEQDIYVHFKSKLLYTEFMLRFG